MADKQYEPHKKIEPVDGLDAKRQVQLDPSLENDIASEGAIKIRFDDALDKAMRSNIMHPTTPSVIKPVAKADGSGTSNKPSLMDVARSHSVQGEKSIADASPSIQDIQNQALQLRDSFSAPRAILMGPTGTTTLPPETLSSLNGYIEHADSALKEASSSVKGVEVGSLIEQDKPPMMKFLRFLTDGDHRVGTIIDDISKLDLKGGKLTPALLMAVQIKLGFVQQELEFFTNVLNKSLESTKTIMNVQI